MALFRRNKAQKISPDLQHLLQFVNSRQGVEAYLEPKTAVTEMTVALVASDGEWTRRRVPNAELVRKFADQRGIPVYDAATVGYPEKMREWTHKQKQAGDAAVEDIDRP
ncbi:MAG: hypothetical protein H0T85_02200 [Geodermatophilaceae bacterium]|nr:hypothetical protein [Geodermatophilaceae bacterium]